MVVIPLAGQQIHDERWVSQAAKHCRGKESPVETVSYSLPEDPEWTPIDMSRAIGDFIQESLNFSWGC
jgi:hypothetical protein